MREPHQHPRQDRAPALVVGARIAGLQRRVVRDDERLDEVEHRVPQPRLDGRALLVVLRVLVREPASTGSSRASMRSSASTCPGPTSLRAAGEARDELERFLLDRQRIGRSAATRSSATRCVALAQRVVERPDPGDDRLRSCAAVRGARCRRRRQRPRPSSGRPGSSRRDASRAGRRRGRRRRCRGRCPSGCRRS